jgi:hypothetical protein
MNDSVKVPLVSATPSLSGYYQVLLLDEGG